MYTQSRTRAFIAGCVSTPFGAVSAKPRDGGIGLECMSGDEKFEVLLFPSLVAQFYPPQLCPHHEIIFEFYLPDMFFSRAFSEHTRYLFIVYVR